MCSECSCWHHNENDIFQNFAIWYDFPSYYEILTDNEKKEFNTEINEDLCKIEYPEETAYFIKSVLQIPVFKEHKENFIEFLVWVTISEKDFYNYKKNFENTEFESKFKWFLANNLYNYDYCLDIQMEIIIEKWKMPFLFPKKEFSHELVKNFYEWMWEKKFKEILKNFM